MIAGFKEHGFMVAAEHMPDRATRQAEKEEHKKGEEHEPTDKDML